MVIGALASIEWEVPKRIRMKAIDVNIVLGKLLILVKIKDHIIDAAIPTPQDLRIRNIRDFENLDTSDISAPGSCIIEITKKILNTSVRVASTIAEDFNLLEIFIFSTKGITTAGDMLAIMKPKSIEC